MICRIYEVYISYSMLDGQSETGALKQRRSPETESKLKDLERQKETSESLREMPAALQGSLL